MKDQDSPPVITESKEKKDSLFELDKCVRIQLPLLSQTVEIPKCRQLRILRRYLIFNRCTYPPRGQHNNTEVIAEYHLRRACWHITLSDCSVEPADIIGAPRYQKSQDSSVSEGTSHSQLVKGDGKLSLGTKNGIAGELALGGSNTTGGSQTTTTSFASDTFALESFNKHSLILSYEHPSGTLFGRDAGNIAVIKDWTNNSEVRARGIFTEKDLSFDFKSLGLWKRLSNGLSGLSIKKAIVRAILDDLNVEILCKREP